MSKEKSQMTKSKFIESFSIFGIIWLTIKMNARNEGICIVAFIMKSILKTLALTIPGFILVWFYPIRSNVTYGWLCGIWHGWFALCNMIIHLFSPDTLYAAPLSTIGYEVWWWISCVCVFFLLYSFFIMRIVIYRDKRDVLIISQSADIKPSIDKRTIKVFISSTFQDMREERDYLMTHIFPSLQEIAAKRNVNFVPIDLRWGITAEESKTGKVLELCLQEIDNSIPFFIGIIGERYGWCPSDDEFKKSKLLQEKYPWIEQDFKQHLSVTEIEMQYGVLRRKERINAIFFTTNLNTLLFSGMDSEYGRIDRLKKAIAMDGRYPLINAIGADQVGEKVLELYVNYLNQYFPLNEDAQLQEIHHSNNEEVSDETFINDYLSIYGKKLSDKQLATIMAHPLSKDRDILKTFLDELVNFGKYEELEQHIEFLLEANTPCQFYKKMLECYEQQYNQREVRDFFSIMRLTGYGLKVKDALEIADVDYCGMFIDGAAVSTSPLSGIKAMAKGISIFRRKPFDQYFQMYLKRNGDLISLSHKAMQQAVDERYLTDEETVRNYRMKIESDLDTYIYKDSDKNLGRIEEEAHQKLMLGQYDDLIGFLDLDVVRRYFERHRPELYNHFIQALSHSTRHQM